MNYNVDEYTELELISLMDLNHPTDGELEAKILFFIKKYDTNPQFKQFFEAVYTRFFDTEGFTSETISNVQSTSYVAIKDYTVSAINPLLKETTQRIISIDSQYRNQDVYPKSTDYTFNLSQSLNNVVSLKLYSIQLPYSWSTISNAYGSNFFYIKGNSPGIMDASYRIQIQTGSYTAPNLMSVLRDEFTKVRDNNTDINWNTTDINFNPYNFKANITLDIKNIFNESNYYLDWNTEQPSQDDRLANIPSFLGYDRSDQSYVPYSFYSDLSTSSDPLRQVTILASSIIIKQSNRVIHTIIINADTYTISDLMVKINEGFEGLNRLQFKSPSGITGPLSSALVAFDNDTQIENPHYYKMIISLDRTANTNASNLITTVEFSHDIQTAFGFKASYTINNIVSEYPTLINTYTSRESMIKLICTKSTYVSTVNDIYIRIPNGSYILTDYLNAIQNALKANNSTTTSTIQTNADHYISLKLDIIKVFDSSMYKMDMKDSILDKNMNFNELYLNLTAPIQSGISLTTGGNYAITVETRRIRVIPTDEGNQNSQGYTIQLPIGSFNSIDKLTLAITATLTNESFDIISESGNITHYAPIVNNYGTFITGLLPASIDLRSNDLSLSTIICNRAGTQWTFNVHINNTLGNDDYRVEFEGVEWNKYLYIPIGIRNVTPPEIIGTQKVLLNKITISSNNNTFYLKPLPTAVGVYTSTFKNDIKFTVPPDQYTTETLMDAINWLFDENTLTKGSLVSKIDGPQTALNNQYSQIKLVINKIYTNLDYNLVFYDVYSFVYCNIGVTGLSSQQNITPDSTLGWIMGFRKNIYTLSDISIYTENEPENNSPKLFDEQTKIITLRGNAPVNVNLYNYFLIILDDYSLNKVDDGLITLTSKESTIHNPSYSTPITYICDPVTHQTVASSASSGNRLTANQLYSTNEIMASRAPQSHKYSRGPCVADMFGLIPIKTTGLSNGQVYVDFSGTLQNQSRNYFGPTNIQRMTIRLINDRGTLVDLNQMDWSFSLLCDQLYTQPNSKP